MMNLPGGNSYFLLHRNSILNPSCLFLTPLEMFAEVEQEFWEREKQVERLLLETSQGDNFIVYSFQILSYTCTFFKVMKQIYIQIPVR